MKKRFVFGLLLLSFKFQTQVSFYVEPIIQSKAFICSTSSNSLKNEIDDSDSRIHIRKKFFLNAKKMQHLFFGLNVGLKTQNERNFLQFGVNNDQSVTGVYAVFDAIQMSDGFEYEAGYILNSGTNFINFHLDYLYRLNKNPKRINFYFKTGFGFAYRPTTNNMNINSRNLEVNIDKETFMINNSVGSNSNNKTSFLLNLGLACDVNSKKGKYLFSSSLFYTYSSTVLNQINSNVDLYTISGVENKNYKFYSKGSGIYLQLSRRFQLYPWKKFKLKKDNE
jgi:hypothetical protein